MLDYNDFRQQAKDIPDAYIRKQARASCSGFFKAALPSILVSTKLAAVVRIKTCAELLDDYHADDRTKFLVLSGLYILTWYEQQQSLSHYLDDTLISLCQKQLGVKRLDEIDQEQWRCSLEELSAFIGWLYHDKQLTSLFSNDIQSQLSVIKARQSESMSIHATEWLCSWMGAN